MWRWVARLAAISGDEHDGDATHVSTACRRSALRHDSTRGVDLPTWRTPKEIEEMRRFGRRAALRLVPTRTGTNDR